MADVLGAVYNFVLKYAHDNVVPQYRPNQIIRGWQNMAALPKNTTEFCVLTLLNSVRHGTNFYSYINQKQGLDFNQAKLTEHLIQLDFCGAEPFEASANTKRRAELINLFGNSYTGVDFFEAQDSALSCLYADDVIAMSGFDETKTFSARYLITLHISELIQAVEPVDYFTDVTLHLEDVDVYHPAKKGEK